MKNIALLFVFFAVVLVNAHDKMNTPAPRVAVESQAFPCGSGNGAQMSPVVSVAAGNNLLVGWDGNHNGGSVRLSLVFAETTPSSTALQNGLLTNPNTGTHDFAYPTPKNVTVPIPSNLPTSTYTLQWEWTSGPWYSCAEINVQGTGALSVVNPGSSASFSSDPAAPLYYRITIPANDNINVVVNGPPSLTFAAAVGVIPTLTTYDGMIVGSGTPYSMSVCGDTNGSPSNAVIGVFTTSGNNSVPFTISSSVYASYLDILQNPPQIHDTLAVGGNKFYWTQAYDTLEKPKRVVLEKSSGSAPIGLSKSTTCSANPVPQYTGDSFVCFDLGPDTGTKYIEVTSTAPMTYELSLEIGKCADRKPSDSAATVLALSPIMAFILACLLLLN